MKNSIEPGSILISKPFIDDTKFEKTIILVVEHNKNGTIGFVINQTTNIELYEILNNIKHNNLKLKNGGPVEQNTLFFIHTYPDLIQNSQKIKDGVFWGGNMEDVIKGLENDEIKSNQIAFFMGYCGWEPNQLQAEIYDGSWIIHQIDIKRFNETIDWSQLLIEIDEEYKVWATAPSTCKLDEFGEIHLN